MKKRTIFGLAIVGAAVGAGIYAVKRFLDNTEITIEEEFDIDDLDDEDDLNDEDDFCECGGKCKCHNKDKELDEKTIPGQMTLDIEEETTTCECEEEKQTKVVLDTTNVENEDKVVFEKEETTSKEKEIS